MILVNLFLAFLRIGMFAIGGAYSFLPLIEREVVEKYHWLTKEEFLDVLGTTQAFPGAISIKYATYTGYKTAGVIGALLANLGNLATPVVLVIFTSVLYARYKDLPRVKGALNMIELVVFSMILAVTFKLISFDKILQLKNLPIIIISFGLFYFTKTHPALIIICAAILGAIMK